MDLDSLTPCPGDSFHDRDAHDRLSDANRAILGALQARRDWIWIAGNHDPELPCNLGGSVASEVAIGAVAFRHEPTGACGEIATSAGCVLIAATAE